MGFLDFLFKKNYDTEDIVDPIHDYAYDKQDADPLPREYSDKGVTFRKNLKSKPYLAYITLNKKNKDGKAKAHQFYIGYYSTKEEAQKARWEFIESLK